MSAWHGMFAMLGLGLFWCFALAECSFLAWLLGVFVWLGWDARAALPWIGSVVWCCFALPGRLAWLVICCAG